MGKYLLRQALIGGWKAVLHARLRLFNEIGPRRPAWQYQSNPYIERFKLQCQGFGERIYRHLGRGVNARQGTDIIMTVDVTLTITPA